MPVNSDSLTRISNSQWSSHPVTIDNYRQGQNRYIYREKLSRMHRRNLPKIEVNIQHLGEYDPEMLGLLRNAPGIYIPAMELAAMDAVKTLLYEQGNRDGRQT
jgi:DNA replicative helicase MCM subunit Mcm2 (Cdc46/Mcm family)